MLSAQSGAVQMQAGSFDSFEMEKFRCRLEQAMRGGRDILIDTVEKRGEDTVGLRDATARRLGVLTKELLDSQASQWYLPMIIGGDTLLGAVKQLPCSEIRPWGEVAPGVVLFEVPLSSGRTRWMLSKSGGFGQEDLLLEIRRNLNGGKTG